MVLNSVKRLPGQHLKGKKNLVFSIHIVTYSFSLGPENDACFC